MPERAHRLVARWQRTADSETRVERLAASTPLWRAFLTLGTGTVAGVPVLGGWAAMGSELAIYCIRSRIGIKSASTPAHRRHHHCGRGTGPSKGDPPSTWAGRLSRYADGSFSAKHRLGTTPGRGVFLAANWRGSHRAPGARCPPAPGVKTAHLAELLWLVQGQAERVRCRSTEGGPQGGGRPQPLPPQTCTSHRGSLLPDQRGSGRREWLNHAT
jgi:hypothetical protein